MSSMPRDALKTSAWKPGVIGRADQRPGAVGVMLDDLWAGLFAGVATIIAAGIAHGVLMR